MIKKIFLSKEDLSDFETQWHPLEMEGYFVTKEELIEIRREAFEAGRKIVIKRTPNMDDYMLDGDVAKYKTADDYLKQKEQTELSCKRCGKSIPKDNGIHSCVIKEPLDEKTK